MLQEQITETAFKKLFDKEYNNLCRYAYTYVQDEHLAEDVVQDTFIKIWEQKKDLINTENIRYYLVTSVRNNCISELRKKKQVFYTEEAPQAEPEPFFSQMLHREQYTEQQQRLAAALDKLPPKCKEVFLLIKLHGMSYKQAAASLEISVKTVENQMGKAIKIFQNPTVAVLMVVCGWFLMHKWSL